ncbi:hypothetical protein [Deinococcus yunweiensis]|uniref:hypothetical protein n=1 Tax=Deinococcus yunweiensis TaxID=367282 RepID=UPI00398E4AFA
MILDERRRAIHELGHALVAMSFGWPIVNVGIDIGDHSLGATQVVHPDEDALLEVQVSEDEQITVREKYEQLLIQLAAGSAAEELIYGGIGDSGDPYVPTSDRAKFLDLIDRWQLRATDYGALRFGVDQPFAASTQAAKAIMTADFYEPLFDFLAGLLVKDRLLTGPKFYEAVLQYWQSHVSSGVGSE